MASDGTLPITVEEVGYYAFDIHPAPVPEPGFITSIPVAPIPIPNGTPVGLDDTLVVSSHPINAIKQISVWIYIRHGLDTDLTLDLIGPDGVTAARLGLFGATLDTRNYRGVIYNDYAFELESGRVGSVYRRSRPDTPLHAFEGMSANGTWTLRMVDPFAPNISQNSGELVGWGLYFE